MDIFKKLQQNSFFRNVFVVAGGTVVGQGIVVLSSPILTRLYTPDDIGKFTLYTSLFSIFLSIISLRFELAIPLEKNIKKAWKILFFSIIIILFISSILLFIFGIFSSKIPFPEKFSSISPFLWLLPIGLFFGGINQVFEFWSIRNNRFIDIGKSKIVKNSSMVFVHILSGLFLLGPEFLIIGDVVGRFLSSSYFLRISIVKDRLLENINKPFEGLFALVNKYKNFLTYSSIAVVFNRSGLQLPIIVLNIYYGTEITGLFGLSQRVMGIPIMFIGQALSQVYFGRAAQLAQVKSEDLRKLFLETSKKLLLFGIIPILFVGLVGPKLFSIIFGNEWALSGMFVRILIPLYILQFAVTPLSQTLNILGKQSWQLGWDILRLIIVFASINFGNILGNGDPIWGIAIYSISMSALYITMFFLNLHAIKVFSR